MIKMVACGAKHTLALDLDGSIWFWGCKSSVGIDDIEHEHQKYPAILIKSTEIEPFVHIASRNNTNMAVTATGRIITFGEEERKNDDSLDESYDECEKGNSITTILTFNTILAYSHRRNKPRDQGRPSVEPIHLDVYFFRFNP